MILQMLFYFIKNLNGFIRFLTTQIIYFICFRNNSYKTSNSQLIRLLEPIYLLRVREASD